MAVSKEATGEIYKRNFTTFRCVIYFDYLGSMLLIFFPHRSNIKCYFLLKMHFKREDIQGIK